MYLLVFWSNCRGGRLLDDGGGRVFEPIEGALNSVIQTIGNDQSRYT